MKDWVILAIISMIFAGATSAFAKLGMSNVSGESALTIRTTTVFLIISCWFLFSNNMSFSGFSNITTKDTIFLVLSGVTTALSWIFYFKSMKIGEVNYVAAIDKGQIIITVILTCLFLGESLSWKLIVGTVLILLGTFVLTLK
jgi:transporter family protein